MYVQGSSSLIPRPDAPDLSRFPRAAHLAACCLRAALRPGDVLFIPALWFHSVSWADFTISINVFWRGLPPELYDPRDVYGAHWGHCDAVPRWIMSVSCDGCSTFASVMTLQLLRIRGTQCRTVSCCFVCAVATLVLQDCLMAYGHSLLIWAQQTHNRLLMFLYTSMQAIETLLRWRPPPAP